MKKFIMFLMIGLMLDVAAAKSMFDGMSKEQLAEYDIVIVNKKTGKEVGRMSRAEYKVVKIGSESVLKQNLVAEQKITAGMERTIRDQQQQIEENSAPTNSVILHLGAGKDGLDRSYNNGVYEISEKDKAVGGVTGCRTYGDKGLCASAFTNSLFTLGLKLDFK